MQGFPSSQFLRRCITFAPAVTGIDSASIAVIAVLSSMVAFSIHTGVDSARIAVIAVLLAMSAFSIHTGVDSAGIAVIAVLLPMSTCPVLAGVGSAGIAVIAIPRVCERIRFHSMCRWYKRCRHRISLKNERTLHSNNSLSCSRFDHRSLSAYECISLLAGINCAGIAIITVYGSMNAFFSIPGICSAGIVIITEMKEGRGLICSNDSLVLFMEISGFVELMNSLVSALIL